ncbi:MAG: LuxR family transcriptional regulator [Planctomycetaceae bacterium]|nr:LuxR family transcriptional regulator [Planctomycetaceae bacterium]
MIAIVEAARLASVGMVLGREPTSVRREAYPHRVFDTHCHLTFDCFEDRIDAVLADARSAGVRGCISISTTTADLPRLTGLADRHPTVWCSSGVHPLYSDRPIDWNAMELAARHSKCVAWGELGLDHHYPRPDRDLQRSVLEEQLARIEAWTLDGLSKPVVVHCRKAFTELIPILEASTLPNDRFVFHCFTGDEADARAVLDFGGWLSFTGIVTFANAAEVARASDLVPDDRIMVETDAPFLTPEPHRNVRPNEPRYVGCTAAFLAARRSLDPEAFERVLDANAGRFFGIEIP